MPKGEDYSPPFSYSNISPGWQSNTSQIASNVEKRIALILPVLILDKFTLDTPTFSDNSFKLIFRSAMTLSNHKIIFPILPPSYRVSSDSCCNTAPYLNIYARTKINRITTTTPRSTPRINCTLLVKILSVIDSKTEFITTHGKSE